MEYRKLRTLYQLVVDNKNMVWAELLYLEHQRSLHYYQRRMDVQELTTEELEQSINELRLKLDEFLEIIHELEQENKQTKALFQYHGIDEPEN